MDNISIAERAMGHLRVLRDKMADAGGYIELRAIPEMDKSTGAPKSHFISVDADDSAYEDAVKWMGKHSDRGSGIFVGMNPRVRESGSKKDVERMTTAYVDLDIYKAEGGPISKEEAIEEIIDLMPIEPDYIAESGAGLQVVYFTKPTDDTEAWTDLQETLYRKFKHLGADRAVVSDTSRVLRLTPFPNWKWDKEAGGRPTAIARVTDHEMIPSIQTAHALFDVQPGISRADKNGNFKLPRVMPEGGGTESGGGRNELLFKEASSLRRRGYEMAEILITLRGLNETRCIPPLPDHEVMKIAEGVASRYETTLSLGTSKDYEVGAFGYPLKELLERDIPMPEWIIHGLNNGEMGQIVAIPNLGKSTLALNLSMSMAAGVPFPPLFDGGGGPKRVMYLDFENREAFFQKDMKMMIRNFDEEDRELIKENLFVAVDAEIGGVEMNLSSPDHVHELARQANRHKADLIIVDTMAAGFSLINENDNSEAERAVVKPLKQVARETGAAILLVHHKGKRNETGDTNEVYAGRGASAFAAAFRLILTLKPMVDGSGRQIDNHVILKAAKVKGPVFDDTVFALDFSRRWFEAASIALPDKTSTYESIWNIVNRPLKRKEIIEEAEQAGIGVSKETIKRALKTGVSTNRLVKEKHGIYQPADYEEDDDKIIEEEILECAEDEEDCSEANSQNNKASVPPIPN